MLNNTKKIILPEEINKQLKIYTENLSIQSDRHLQHNNDLNLMFLILFLSLTFVFVCYIGFKYVKKLENELETCILDIQIRNKEIIKNKINLNSIIYNTNDIVLCDVTDDVV